jgi:hypothetical protein
VGKVVGAVNIACLLGQLPFLEGKLWPCSLLPQQLLQEHLHQAQHISTAKKHDAQPIMAQAELWQLHANELTFHKQQSHSLYPV